MLRKSRKYLRFINVQVLEHSTGSSRMSKVYKSIIIILALITIISYALGVFARSANAEEPTNVISGSDFVQQIYISGTYTNVTYYSVVVKQPKALEPCNIVPISGNPVIKQKRNNRCDGVVFGAKGDTIGFWYSNLLNGNLALATYILTD